jgi:hypothetical protein
MALGQGVQVVLKSPQNRKVLRSFEGEQPATTSDLRTTSSRLRPPSLEYRDAPLTCLNESKIQHFSYALRGCPKKISNGCC